jgi:predicted kinase
MIPTFTILVGISGSGKSTWIKKQKLKNTIIICPDDIRKKLTGSISDQSKNKEVFEYAFSWATASLDAGKNVIFDALNNNSEHRRRMLKHIKENTTKIFIPLAKIFPADPEISKQRVKKDIDQGVDRSAVPPDAIDRQYEKFMSDIGKIESDGYTVI